MVSSLPALRTLVTFVEEDQKDMSTDRVKVILYAFFSKPSFLEKLCIGSNEICEIWCRSRDDTPTGWGEVSYVIANKPRGRFDYLEIIDPRAGWNIAV